MSFLVKVILNFGRPTEVWQVEKKFKYCYKVIQQFRVTCFIAGQYNAALLWHITEKNCLF